MADEQKCPTCGQRVREIGTYTSTYVPLDGPEVERMKAIIDHLHTQLTQALSRRPELDLFVAAIRQACDDYSPLGDFPDEVYAALAALDA